ncbi:hypothetical protein [Vibrio comitans]
MTIFLALIFSLSVPLANAASFSKTHPLQVMEETRQNHHSQMTDCDSIAELHHVVSDAEQLAIDCFGQEHCGHTCCQSTCGNPLSFSGSEARYATLVTSLSPINTYQSEPQSGVSNSLYRPPIA